MDGYESDGSSSSWDSDDFSRNAKTAPSTPEAEQRSVVPPRHAESTSNLERLRNSHPTAPALPLHPYSSPGDLAITQKLPEKLDSKPKRKKSRNEKFHKLFKSIPQEETVLKCYSCAYFGDILLQGYLYVSPNYFCFYSKILGRAKQIQIPVKKVLNITREKTAIIIPNAIGILTPQDKYVFGSLMSRDNTHRYLCQLVENVRAANGMTFARPLVSSDMEGLGVGGSDNNNKPTISVVSVSDMQPSHTSDDDDEEEEEEEEEEDEEDEEFEEEDLSGVSEDSGGLQCEVCSQRRSHSQPPHICTAPPPPLTTHSPPDPPAATPSPRPPAFQRPAPTPAPNPTPSLVPTPAPTTALPPTSTNGVHKTKAPAATHTSQSGSWNVLQLLPSCSSQSSVLLTISSVLVLLLSVSAIVMAYKIVLLQAKIETATPYEGLSGVYKDMYYINDQYHTATIRRFHSVLEANIHVLDQVYSSLRTLQQPPGFLAPGSFAPHPSRSGGQRAESEPPGSPSLARGSKATGET